jgi:hypothetical protein
MHLKGIRNRIIEIIALSNPKYRIFVFLIILFLLFIIPVNFLGAVNLSPCPRILGNYCYSAGITRGVSSLLKGNVTQAAGYNPLSIPVLITMISIVISDFLKIRK